MEKRSGGVYTMMMMLSFAALLTGFILLYQELKLYGAYPWWR